MVLDLGENDTFIAQETYHWVNTQAPIHPVVMQFHKQESNPAEVSACCCYFWLSGAGHSCNTHTSESSARNTETRSASTKKKFIISVTALLRNTRTKRTSWISATMRMTIHCQQNEISLVLQTAKAQVTASVAHLERLAVRSSFQRPFQDQIQTPKDLYAWAKHNIKGITVIWVPSSKYKKQGHNLVQDSPWQS